MMFGICKFHLKTVCLVQKKIALPRFLFFSSPELKGPGELLGWDMSHACLLVRPLVRLSSLSNMNISETRWPIKIIFHLEHHWGWGKAALSDENWFPWQQISPIGL